MGSNFTKLCPIEYYFVSCVFSPTAPLPSYSHHHRPSHCRQTFSASTLIIVSGWSFGSFLGFRAWLYLDGREPTNNSLAKELRQWISDNFVKVRKTFGRICAPYQPTLPVPRWPFRWRSDIYTVARKKALGLLHVELNKLDNLWGVGVCVAKITI